MDSASSELVAVDRILLHDPMLLIVTAPVDIIGEQMLEAGAGKDIEIPDDAGDGDGQGQLDDDEDEDPLLLLILNVCALLECPESSLGKWQHLTR